MAGEGAPLSNVLGIPVAAAAAGADASGLQVAPFSGVITAVEFIPLTVLTGANTESRTVQLFNRGQAGAGTVKPAEKAFISGVNAPALDSTNVTLSVTAADLNVVAGDVLEAKSLHVGGTGLAGPQGIVRVTFSRTAGS